MGVNEVASLSHDSTRRPLVSVICTVRNGGATLKSVLDSILHQTLTDWEMIVVDDGSTDETPELIEQAQQHDKRVRFVRTSGIGRGKALNLALGLSRGKYIANVDADDPSHPRRLEIQTSVLEHRTEFGMLCTSCLWLRDDDEPEWPDVQWAGPDTIPILDVTETLSRRNPVLHSSAMIRAHVMRAVGGYDEERTSQFDYDAWVRIAIAGYRIGSLGMPLASKRIHKGQQFEGRRRLRYVINSLRVQARAITGLRAGAPAWMFLGARLIWGCLPAGIRHLRRR